MMGQLNELERVSNKAVMAYLEILSQCLSRWIEEDYEDPHSE
jgi:hypothetical protein